MTKLPYLRVSVKWMTAATALALSVGGCDDEETLRQEMIDDPASFVAKLTALVRLHVPKKL